MSDQTGNEENAFIGEVRLFPYGFTPDGWHACDGATLRIKEHATLYSLIGTLYGGDKITTFNLPDLRGTAALGQGKKDGSSNFELGKIYGNNSETISGKLLQQHTHQLRRIGASKNHDKHNTPKGTYDLGSLLNVNITKSIPSLRKDGVPNTRLHPDTVGITGGGAHENRQPFLALNYCICIDAGTYPHLW